MSVGFCGDCKGGADGCGDGVGITGLGDLVGCGADVGITGLEDVVGSITEINHTMLFYIHL